MPRILTLTLLPLLSALAATAARAQSTGPDFDGDGLTDVAAYEVQNDGSTNEIAVTWRLSSNLSVNKVEFGKRLESAVYADYDGDGITDRAVVGVAASGQLAWRYQLSSANYAVSTDIFGNIGDLVFYGCKFDTDAKADRAVVNASGVVYFQKSSDLSIATVALPNGNFDRYMCADVDGDGIDEIVAQSASKVSVSKRNRRSAKKPRTTITDRSNFFAWNLAGQKVLERQVNDKAKAIFAADVDGDGRQEIGFERPAAKGKKGLVFLNDQNFTVSVPAFVKMGVYNFNSPRGGVDGLLLKMKNEKLLKINDIRNPAIYEEIDLPSTDYVLSTRGATSVGPLQSRETICNQHMETRDGHDGFLWKPVSDTQGTSVVLLPYPLRLKNVRILKNGQLIEKLRSGGVGNGARQHWRSVNRATYFDDNITITGIQNGINYCWLVDDPLQRID